MSKHFYSLLLGLNFLWFNAQVSDRVKELAQPLNNISHAESSHIGIAGEESKIYNQFKKIAKVASNDELYYFAKNGSNALKIYSGKELLKRKDKRFFEVYKFYSEKPLIVKYIMGCIGSNKNISELLKDEVYASRQYILMRDSLLKEKSTPAAIKKIQLRQIKELGYGTFTKEDFNSAIKQLKEIDSMEQH